MDYRIYPPEELIEEALIKLPQSKSILNRRLLLATLAGDAAGFPAPEGEESRDIIVMRSALEAIASTTPGEMTINIGESGSAMRFLTAVLAARPGCDVLLTGEPGVIRRPVGGLVEALRSCGAQIEYTDAEGHLPLRIHGCELTGGVAEIDPSLSSQYVSALLMVGPLMKEGLILKFKGEITSLPYVKMTVGMMQNRGIDVTLSPLMAIVKPGKYGSNGDLTESDWSAAAFWYEIVALTAGWITLEGVKAPGDSLQGDAAAARFFECLGVMTEVSEIHPFCVELSPSPDLYGRLDLDLSDYPDLTPALTVTCCMLGIPFKFTGLAALKIKECDRLVALIEEMEKVGCTIENLRDSGMEWDGKRHPIIAMPEFDPRGDHRLAMAFAPVAAYIPGIVIKDTQCVDKSYPGYWDDLRSVGFRTVDPSLPVEEPTAE